MNRPEHSAFPEASLVEVWDGALSTGASFQVRSDIVIPHRAISDGSRAMIWTMKKCAMDGIVKGFIT